MTGILRLHEPLRLFIMTLGSSILVFALIFSTYYYFFGRRVMLPVETPFEVCTPEIRPGETLCYIIHYYKFRPIPGRLTKALNYLGDNDELIAQVPLETVSGNLPVGEIKQRAYVHIPSHVPCGEKVVLSLTASHDLGIYIQDHQVLTKPFKILRKSLN